MSNSGITQFYLPPAHELYLPICYDHSCSSINDICLVPIFTLMLQWWKLEFTRGDRTALEVWGLSRKCDPKIKPLANDHSGPEVLFKTCVAMKLVDDDDDDDDQMPELKSELLWVLLYLHLCCVCLAWSFHTVVCAERGSLHFTVALANLNRYVKLQDRDKTSSFQRTSPDWDIRDRDYIPAY